MSVYIDAMITFLDVMANIIILSNNKFKKVA